MLISHRKRFIYTKTIKTGGTSVEAYFEPYCFPPGEYRFQHFRPQYESAAGIVGFRGQNKDRVGNTWYNHAPAREIRSKIGDDIWSAYFKFCVLRNPFDKLVSAFHFFGPSRSQCERLPFGEVREHFREWMLCRTFPRDWNIFTIDDRICVDYIIRFEQLLRDVEDVCRRLDIPFDAEQLPHLKGELDSPRRPFSEYYDRETIQIAAEAYARELRLFGYPLPKASPMPRR